MLLRFGAGAAEPLSPVGAPDGDSGGAGRGDDDELSASPRGLLSGLRCTALGLPDSGVRLIRTRRPRRLSADNGSWNWTCRSSGGTSWRLLTRAGLPCTEAGPRVK